MPILAKNLRQEIFSHLILQNVCEEVVKYLLVTFLFFFPSGFGYLMRHPYFFSLSRICRQKNVTNPSEKIQKDLFCNISEDETGMRRVSFKYKVLEKDPNTVVHVKFVPTFFEIVSRYL